MPTTRRNWNQNTFSRYKKEGRGSGEGSDYVPWIKVQDFPSKGWSSKTPSWKTKRVHEFPSNHELRTFYILEWSDKVIDIREQYPLIDLERAQRIAREIGINYPTDKKSGMPYVLTTDFMITQNVGGSEEYIARTVKPASELAKKSVISKFEIERRYWKELNIDWGIITEKEIPLVLANNISLIHSDYYFEPTEDLTENQMLAIALELKDRLKRYNTTVVNITKSLDKELRLEAGTSLRIFKYLVARKEVLLNMNVKIDFRKITTWDHQILNDGQVVSL